MTRPPGTVIFRLKSTRFFLNACRGGLIFCPAGVLMTGYMEYRGSKIREKFAAQAAKTDLEDAGSDQRDPPSRAKSELRNRMPVSRNYFSWIILGWFGVVTAALCKFNVMMVKELRVVANRQIEVSTVGVFSSKPRIFHLDDLLPPIAYTGSYSDFQTLRFVTDKGHESFWIASQSTTVHQSSWERALLTEILQSNLIDPQKPPKVAI